MDDWLIADCPINTGVSDSRRIRDLELSISDYMQVMNTFEKERLEIERLRKDARSDEAALIDENLVMNARALELLKERLDSLRAQLAQERAQK